jgi:GT2 family glycosyltransferase
LQSLETSGLNRITTPLRRLREMLRPRGFDAAALIPWRHLEPVADAPAGTWRATAADPQFLVPCYLPAGWVRVRLRMTTAVLSQWALYVDPGVGFCPAERIEQAEACPDTTADFYVHLPRAARAVRFDPLGLPGEFRIEELRVEPVPAPRMWLRALGTKVRLLRQHGLVSRALFRGLELLAAGRFDVFRRKFFNALRQPSVEPVEFHDLDRDYQTWRRRRALHAADRERLRTAAGQMANAPKISVLMPVYNVAPKYLTLAIESVRRQLYPHWQLCIADDGSTLPAIRPLLERYARTDPRIQVVFQDRNRGISAASNAALARADGEYVALLDHDDELAEHALLRMAETITADRSLDFVYSDEDKIALDGRHIEPFFKPDWSPELFLGCMYTCHLGVYRRSLVEAIGGFRSEFDGAQDYELVLRLIARNPRIAHVPEILYHWRKLPSSTAASHDAKPAAWDAGRRALQSYLDETGRQARVEPGKLPGLHRVRFALKGRPKVSIVIPSACREVTVAGKPGFLVEQCARSIRERSSYDAYEILLVHRHDELPVPLRDRLGVKGVRCVGYEGPFNWSTASNLGAAAADGQHLLFLNDDTEVIAPGWLEALLEFSQQTEIGAVGAKLTFPNGDLQHTGVITPEALPQHPFHGFPAGHGGYFGSTLLHRNCSAVTGACLMTRAEVFHARGGFDEAFGLNYNDVDYCLRLIQAGYRIVYTPYAHLCHHEALSKPGTFSSELHAFQDRWKATAARDPYYNPNLKAHSADYQIELGTKARAAAVGA